MKKILFLTHTLSLGGGAEKVLSELVMELSNRYEITILERIEGNIHTYDLPKNVKRLRSMSFFGSFPSKNSKLRKTLNFIWSKYLVIITLLLPKLVYRLYITDKYDYEISFNYLYPSYLIANSHNKDSIKVMWIHTDIYDLNYKKKITINNIICYIYNKIQKKAFQKANKIITISNYTTNSINDLFPQNKDKINLIYNGYNFQDIENKANINFQINYNHKYNLISAGRLDKRKNILLQIEAVKHLVEKKYDISLYILGNGPDFNFLKSKISKYNLTNNIYLLGHINNPYPYLKKSDLLLVSSLQEGFPTIIVESLSLGVPVVTTLVGGVDELITPGINGFISEFDPIEYSKCIEDMLRIQPDKTAIKESVIHLTKEIWAQNVSNMLNTL